MSVLDLEHAATAPRRFRSLIQHRDVDEVPLPYSHRQLFFRRAPPLTGTYNVDGLFLIPGGRFMISMSGETLNLWDVGYNMNIPPSAYPLATADNCGRLYALCRTPDGKGVFLASKKYVIGLAGCCRFPNYPILPSEPQARLTARRRSYKSTGLDWQEIWTTRHPNSPSKHG
jgi:hypothetical protein